MGMSIEEHKEHLLDIMDSMPDDACGDWRDSLAYAIETMRKYQMIEQILDDCDLEAWEVLEKVKEVIEDGNET